MSLNVCEFYPGYVGFYFDFWKQKRLVAVSHFPDSKGETCTEVKKKEEIEYNIWASQQLNNVLSKKVQTEHILLWH